MNLKIVILEGQSGVGKTTLRKLYHKYKNDIIIIHRFTPSQYVYGILNKREGNIPLEELLKIDERISDIAVIVHLKADEETITRRREADHPWNPEEVEKLYDFYYSKTPLKVFKIDVTNKTPLNVLEEFKTIIKQIRGGQND